MQNAAHCGERTRRLDFRIMKTYNGKASAQLASQTAARAPRPLRSVISLIRSASAVTKEQVPAANRARCARVACLLKQLIPERIPATNAALIWRRGESKKRKKKKINPQPHATEKHLTAANAEWHAERRTLSYGRAKYFRRGKTERDKSRRPDAIPQKR